MSTNDERLEELRQDYEGPVNAGYAIGALGIAWAVVFERIDSSPIATISAAAIGAVTFVGTVIHSRRSRPAYEQALAELAADNQLAEAEPTELASVILLRNETEPGSAA